MKSLILYFTISLIITAFVVIPGYTVMAMFSSPVSPPEATPTATVTPERAAPMVTAPPGTTTDDIPDDLTQTSTPTPTPTKRPRIRRPAYRPVPPF